jgi:hypothetical protein
MCYKFNTFVGPFHWFQFILPYQSSPLSAQLHHGVDEPSYSVVYRRCLITDALLRRIILYINLHNIEVIRVVDPYLHRSVLETHSN